MTEKAENDSIDNQVEEDDSDPEEYTVEDIRAKRKNYKTGTLEYLIKWKDYPESQNTWEPIENLKCPDIIARFNEKEKSKRKRRSAIESKESPIKRVKTANSQNGASGSSVDPLVLEEDTESASTREELERNGARVPTPEPAEPKLKSFERGLPIEKIVGSSTDDDEKLWFFVKWQGLSELELVDADELEEKAPREMCGWYRERLYYSIKQPVEQRRVEQVRAI